MSTCSKKTSKIILECGDKQLNAYGEAVSWSGEDLLTWNMNSYVKYYCWNKLSMKGMFSMQRILLFQLNGYDIWMVVWYHGLVLSLILLKIK